MLLLAFSTRSGLVKQTLQAGVQETQASSSGIRVVLEERG
jgi:hypothetical protein